MIGDGAHLAKNINFGETAWMLMAPDAALVRYQEIFYVYAVSWEK